MKTIRDYDDAYKLANELVERFRPSCHKCEIAGSLRRREEKTGDIEIVAQPLDQRPPLEFGDKPYLTYFDMILDDLVDKKVLVPRGAQGLREKQYFVFPSYMALDLFIVRPPAQWGPIYCIRTGPKQFSKWVVTPGAGALPVGYIMHDGAVYPGRKVDGKPVIEGEAIPMPREKDFLEFCGLGALRPKDRMNAVPRSWKREEPQGPVLLSGSQMNLI